MARASSTARCRKHGSPVDPAGGCALCRDERAGRSRPARLWMAIPAALLLAAGAWWGTRREPGDAAARREAAPADSPGTAPVAAGARRVPIARALEEESTSPGEAGDTAPVSAEDRSLAAPPAPPPSTGAEPPPEPPRAPTDPEPAPADDPRDFVVPAASGGSL